MNRISVFLVAVALGLTPAAAQGHVVGADELGTAGAFVATSPAASALQANPAASAAVDGVELQAGLSHAFWNVETYYVERETERYGPSEIHAFGAVRLGSGLSLGLALAPVWGPERSSFSNPVAPLTHVLSYSLVPSIAYIVSPAWAVGLGIQLNRTAVAYNPSSDWSLLGDEATYGAGLVLGTRVTLAQGRVVVGLGYRAPVEEDSTLGATVPYALEVGVSYAPSATLRFGMHLEQSGEEHLYWQDRGMSVLIFEPISSATRARLGVEWNAPRWLVVRAGVLYECERHAGITVFKYDEATREGESRAVSPDTAWGFGLGAGVSLSTRLTLDAGARIEWPNETRRMYFGLGLTWALRD